MADEPRQQPVAIRVTRPYNSPDEFLEHELETLTRTSVTLIGAQPRPKGVILRFEVVHTGGGQLLRGEGRVVGYKENALADQPGLVLRFTRLDTKSKALVDRAAAIREARARAALQAAMGEDSLVPAEPTSIAPSSMAPSSIGPMSVPNMPPSWEESGPPTRPHETPAFQRPPSSSEGSFDASTFAEESSSRLDSEPHVPSSAKAEPSARPEPPPAPPPSSPTIADAPYSKDIARPAPAEPFGLSPTAPPVMRAAARARPEPPISSSAVAPLAPVSSKPGAPASSKPMAPVSSKPMAPVSSKPSAPSSNPGIAPLPLPSSRPAMPSSRPSLTRDEREPLLSRLRERAQNVSSERLQSLLRR